MSKNLLNYDNLVEYLRKKGYREIREGEFIVNEDEEFEIADVLVVKKGQNYKEDLSKLKKEIEESASIVEGERKEYGILFVNNYVIFLRRVTDGLRSKVVILRKSLDKISPAFEKKFKKLLKDIGNWQYWNELFDRSDVIEEFYKLYIKARENLLKNIKGIADDKRKEEFADDLLMQLLIIWYLQEKGFLNNDPRYLVTKFKEYKELGFDSYYEFLRELFKAMMSEPNDGIYYKDDKFGRIVVTGPAPFLNGDFEDVEIPDYVFYVEGKTDLLKRVDPKNVKPSDVPILNLFESRDWTEGNIDEFVLGAIFEKLMTAEDRKEKGAYYTPEPITEYICNNTIKPYLVDRINEKFGTKYESLDEFFEKDTNEERYAFLFNEMQNIKILDPACGSGHFLETAINVLVEIYEKIWERARELGFSYENFVILTANEKGEIIKEPLLTIDDENERILKLKFHIIISRNLYGVDILPSAIKVARARLFLSLAKHFDARKGTHIRFPNVHFNLRVGNSLIGFADLNAFEKIEGQATLEQFFAGEDGEPLSIELDKELEDYIKKMDKVIGTNAYALLAEVRDHFGQKLTQDRLKKVLRLRSDLIKILLVSLNTDYAIRLKKLIDEITDRFNQRLNKEYISYILAKKKLKVNEDKLKEIGYFHWIMEFSEVFLEKGGFDIVVGNPPYVELNEIDYAEFLEEDVRNLYDAFIRLSINLLKQRGMFGFIHANSAYCQPKFKKLRDFLYKNANDFIIINFAIRPQPVFKGVMQRTAITICRKDPSEPKRVKTSRYIRLTEENRNVILRNPPIYDSSKFAFQFEDFIPKIGNEIDYRIFSKLFSNPMKLEDIIDDKKGVPIYYHDSGESYWTKALNYEPKGIRNGQEVRASQWFAIKVKPEYADFVLCAINSTLFYWFWLTVSDCRHLTQETIKQFPIPPEDSLTPDILNELKKMAEKLMECYRQNSYYVEKRKGYKSLEFKVNRCKSIVNEIDKLIGKIYGLDDEEIEYLIDYDKEMRTEN